MVPKPWALFGTKLSFVAALALFAVAELHRATLGQLDKTCWWSGMALLALSYILGAVWAGGPGRFERLIVERIESLLPASLRRRRPPRNDR